MLLVDRTGAARKNAGTHSFISATDEDLLVYLIVGASGPADIDNTRTVLYIHLLHP